jgi:hypothetical protein
MTYVGKVGELVLPSTSCLLNGLSVTLVKYRVLCHLKSHISTLSYVNECYMCSTCFALGL